MSKTMGSVYIMVVVAMATMCTATDRQVVTVETKVGTINGYVKDTTFLDETFAIDRFQGIPFGEAPIGKGRFQKPLPKAPLSEPIDAFAHGSRCMQPPLMADMFPSHDIKYSEDCLFLNIYAPHLRNKQEKLAVMVWIYGGGFNFGFTDSYLGDNIAAHGNVIVVTLNYRVSVWGFLSTGNEHAPGNAGLWDQQIGIKWVYDNIETFGGDNQRITIFGESAGSASVFYQALYPGNKGLFKRIIGESGGIDSTWASNANIPEFTKRLAGDTDCNNDDSKAMVECLQSVSSDRLLEIVSNASYGYMDMPMPFNPIQDGDLITYEPRHAFYDSSQLSAEALEMFRSVDVINGVNSAEGSIGVNPFFGVRDAEAFLPSRDEFENKLIPEVINKQFRGESNLKLLSDLVAAEYTNWENPNEPVNVRKQYVNMHGDLAMNAAMYNSLNRHVQETSAASTYMFIFDSRPETPFVKNVTWIEGVPHGEELPFVFGYKSFTGEDDKSGLVWEKQLARDVITLWTNFAKTGNPNKPVSLKIDWLPYTEKHQHYLQVIRDMTSQNVKQRWNSRRANFWTDIVPKVLRAEICTEFGEDETMGTCEKDGGCKP